MYSKNHFVEPGTSSKLAPKFHGPFRIVDLTGVNNASLVPVDNPDVEPKRVHFEDLSKPKSNDYVSSRRRDEFSPETILQAEKKLLNSVPIALNGSDKSSAKKSAQTGYNLRSLESHGLICATFYANQILELKTMSDGVLGILDSHGRTYQSFRLPGKRIDIYAAGGRTPEEARAMLASMDLTPYATIILCFANKLQQLQPAVQIKRLQQICNTLADKSFTGELYVCRALPQRSVTYSRGNHTCRHSVNKAIHHIAVRETRLTVRDLNLNFGLTLPNGHLNHAHYLSDKIHLSNSGYAAMAQRIFAAVPALNGAHVVSSPVGTLYICDKSPSNPNRSTTMIETPLDPIHAADPLPGRSVANRAQRGRVSKPSFRGKHHMRGMRAMPQMYQGQGMPVMPSHYGGMQDMPPIPMMLVPAPQFNRFHNPGPSRQNRQRRDDRQPRGKWNNHGNRGGRDRPYYRR